MINYPEIDDCMSNIWKMREKYNACHPEEEARLSSLLAALSEEARAEFLKRDYVKEYFAEFGDMTYCCKCDGLIEDSEMSHCYISGKGESAEVTCPECCKWLDPIDRNRIG